MTVVISPGGSQHGTCLGRCGSSSLEGSQQHVYLLLLDTRLQSSALEGSKAPPHPGRGLAASHGRGDVHVREFLPVSVVQLDDGRLLADGYDLAGGRPVLRHGVGWDGDAVAV